MKYFSIGDITVMDRSWVAPYVKEVTPMVERHGGVYGYDNTETEGDRRRLNCF
jgi:uncharacterized protein (DUF1330 family)